MSFFYTVFFSNFDGFCLPSWASKEGVFWGFFSIWAQEAPKRLSRVPKRVPRGSKRAPKEDFKRFGRSFGRFKAAFLGFSGLANLVGRVTHIAYSFCLQGLRNLLFFTLAFINEQEKKTPSANRLGEFGRVSHIAFACRGCVTFSSSH